MSDRYVVGIGASAGGLEALNALVRPLPRDVPMLWIVAQHMSPTHVSVLAQLLAAQAPVRVVEVVDGATPELGTIYVTPPDCDVVLREGVLRLLATPPSPASPRPSVNTLFTSLAAECGAHAVGVVLSGSGTDGALGVQAIRAAGGTVIVQEPQSAKYDGMPKAAIQTGAVDLILEPKAVAAALERLAAVGDVRFDAGGASEDVYDRIHEIVRARTGFRLSEYEPATVRRRVARRLDALGLTSLDDYAQRLGADRDEPQALLQETLIGVTSFFRDADAFQALERTIDALVQRHDDDGVIRVWVAGCATGEEAYSIAFLLEEAMVHAKKRDLQYMIFATDVNESSLEKARAGLYAKLGEWMPRGSPDSYLEPHGDQLRVVKGVRNRIVFACHDLLEDPPFSRLDLVSCRNLLIYLVPSAQRRALELFHYALEPGGHLLLGRSESIGACAELYAAVDLKERLFQRVEGDTSQAPPVRLGTSSPCTRRRERAATRAESAAARAQSMLVARYAPPSLVLDETNRIVHFQGDLKPFLDFPQGRADLSLFALVDERLRAELRALVHRARRTHDSVIGDALAMTLDDRPFRVRARVTPMPESGGNLLVAFEMSEIDLPSAPASTREASIVAELERQLASGRTHLGLVIEELESSNDDLQSLKEELQSMNQELQSTNEELQSTNEELQTANEQLRTANVELHDKTDQLADERRRLLGILTGTEAGTWEWHVPSGRVDINERYAQIVGYTVEELSPVTVERLAVLSDPTDRARAFEAFAKHLAGDLAMFEWERRVHHKDGRETWVQDRGAVASYTPDGKPEWVLGTRIDVTARKKVEHDLARQANQLRALVRDAPSGLAMFDREMCYLEASSRWRQLLGLGAEPLGGRRLYDVVPWSVQFRSNHQRALAGERVVAPEVPVERAGGEKGWNHAELVPWFDLDGAIGGVIMSLEDVTAQVTARQRLQQLNEELERRVAERVAELGLARAENDRNLVVLRGIVNALPVGIVLYDASLRAQQWNDEFLKILDLPADPFDEPGWGAQDLVEFLERRGEPMIDAPARVMAERATKETTVQQRERRLRDGRTLDLRVLQLPGDELLAVFADITAFKEAQERLAEAKARLELATSVGLVGIWSIDFATGAMDADEITRRLTHLPLEGPLTYDELRAHVEAANPTDRDRWYAIVAGADTEGLHDFEFDFRPRMGDARVVTNRGSIVCDATGKPTRAIGVVTDITARKNLEEVLRERADAAVQAHDEALQRTLHLQKMELVGNLTSGIAHDFNNLLSVFGFAVDTLQDRVDPSDGDGREALDDLTHAVDRATLLTRQLLGFGRAKSDERAPVDAEVALRAIGALLPRLTGGRIAVKVEAEPDAWLMGSRAGLEQIVLNLAVNARDAMPDGGTLTCRIAITEREVVLTMSDTGAGMDDETRKRVFEPFFTTKSTGTGLGLATVHEIVKRFDGKIALESTLGVGTTFTVSFPRIAKPVPTKGSCPRPAGRRAADARSSSRTISSSDAARSASSRRSASRSLRWATDARRSASSPRRTTSTWW